MERATSMVSALALALAAGCAGSPSQPPSSFEPLDDPLERGDLLVALQARPGGAPDAIVRYRRSLDQDDRLKVQARVLVEPAPAVLAVAGSSSGRWLAATLGASDTVRLWDLRHASGPLTPDAAAWISPPGCSTPRFHPEDEFVALACPAVERAPGHTTPAHVVVVSLPDVQPLALVGEVARTAPAVGVEGDLYWIEDDRGAPTVIRRGADRIPYGVHRLDRPAAELWPMHDGSIVAVGVTATGARELTRLAASGARDRVPPPRDVGRSAGPLDPLSVTPDGDFVFASCTPRPCTVLRARPSGVGAAPLSLSGVPTAVSAVPRFGRAVPHVEDLATAPAGVLATHDASFVSVLGVELGMPMEGVWATLERGGRFPQWLGTEGGRAPTGIGVGAVRSGHCVEFLADDAGRVGAIELQGCARAYLSPALQPLLDREALAAGALPLIRRFLGPGVTAQVGDPTNQGPNRDDQPIRGTNVRYDAPERGYSFEARTEILHTSRARLMNGRLRLRLEPPRADATVGAR